jgi:hypothetical protein
MAVRCIEMFCGSHIKNVSWQYVASKYFVVATLKNFRQVTLKIKFVRQNSRFGTG